MSNTPYKDELIRCATILGLPDDTDPTAVAEAVEALKATHDAAVSAKDGVQRMVDYQQKRGDQFGHGLDEASAALERARDDLRAKADTADTLGLRATVVRVANDLNIAAQAADVAGQEPAPPPQ